MGQLRSDSARFVVRRPGGWALTELPGAEPTPCTVDDVVGSIRSSVGVAPASVVGRGAAVGRRHVVLTPSDVVESRWILVGRVVPGGLVVEDLSGGTLLLDEHDVRLLDDIEEAAVVGQLADLRSGGGEDRPGEVLERLARLVAAGALLARSGADVPAGSGTESSTEPTVLPPPDDASDRGDGRPAAVAASPEVGPSGLGELRHRLRYAIDHSSTLRRLTGRLGVRRTRHSEPQALPAPSPPAPSPPAPVASMPAPERSPDGRVPVYAIWHEDVGPMLSLGMLTATLRHWSGGEFNETFEIRRPENVRSFLDDVEGRHGPAVLLCSDYVWSLEANDDVARRAKAVLPELIVIRGGPSIPRYPEHIGAFFEARGDVADVVVHGEGEITLVELLASLRSSLPHLDLDALAGVAGISFVSPTDGPVRTADRERIADLDALPSPYLTGEFDHIPADAWHICLSIETNRGCPYGCTFCDWGSATMSRIRKFGSERVAAEIEWAARRGQNAVQICDANFGIMARDVETAQRLAEAKRATGYPKFVSWTPAKNTTKHLTRIMDALLGAKLGVSASLSPQTTDPATLEAIDRSNISLDHYLSLAADFRRRGHPLQGDLLLGLPGQSFDTYKADLQFMLDHEIVARTWPLQLLPNAPMNAPEYRERFRIRPDERHLVMSTSTFSEEDRAHMLHLRKVAVVAEQLGLLRHVLRYLQWDHGLPALDVIDRLRRVLMEDPLRYPVVAWTFEYFDLHPTVAVGWASFYEELERFLVDELDVVVDSGLRCVLELQRFLMPSPGRRFPETITLAHDYPSYYRSATERLYVDGRPGRPAQPLGSYAPVEFEVRADPLELCTQGLVFGGQSRDEAMQGDFYVLIDAAYELESPLMSTVLPMVTRVLSEETLAALVASRAPADGWVIEVAADGGDGPGGTGDGHGGTTTGVALSVKR